MSSRARKNPQSRMILPTLALSRFVSGTPGIIFGLLMIEIGQTFKSAVGITGQISTASSILGIISAIVMGAISVRFNHKSLLMNGIVMFLISAIGCSFANNFGMMMIFYTISGIAISTVGPMTSTLVAEYFSTDMRPTAIGWLVAGGSASYLIGAQVTTLIAGISGWRSAFLWFMLPFTLLGLLMTKLFLPSIERNPQTTIRVGGYLEGFKSILSHRSATSCLIGTALRMASFQVILLYGTSLVRQQFSISRSYASVFMTIGALCYTIGSLVTGRFVRKFGRKTITIIVIFLASIFTIIFTFSSNLWLAVAADFLSAWFFGMSVSAGQSLNLEQVPVYRGTMMSLSSAVGSTGSAVGAGLGGLVILQYGYETLGLSLGIFGIASSLILHFLASDPTRD